MGFSCFATCCYSPFTSLQRQVKRGFKDEVLASLFPCICCSPFCMALPGNNLRSFTVVEWKTSFRWSFIGFIYSIDWGSLHPDSGSPLPSCSVSKEILGACCGHRPSLRYYAASY
uniref:Uncharacterized protein n=1 Tax=Arundo donax TaxID=35708 RepID=A0A0A8Y2D3_ARUDO